MSTTTQSVSELAHQCLSKFDEALFGRVLTQNQWAENRRADFNLWVDGVGAMAGKGPLSMLDSSPDADDEDILEEAKQNVDATFDNLASIAVAIRHTGRKSRLLKADKSFDPNILDDLRTHLECITLIGRTLSAESHQEHHENDPLWWEDEMKGTLTPLQRRLIEANLQRRNRFLYAQRHSKKLAHRELSVFVSQTQTVGPQPPEPERVATPSAQMNVQFQQPGPSVQKEPPLASVPTLSGTSASVPESKLEWKESQDVIQVPMSQFTSIACVAKYPMLASLHKSSSQGMNRIEFDQPKILKCPCCCEALPNGVIQSMNAWKFRKHLSADFCPYTCIAENCPMPHVLYRTRAEWEGHMKKHHPKNWKCQLCDVSQITLFSNVDDLTQHVSREHRDSFPEELLGTLHLWPSLSSIGLDTCPLCRSTGPRDDPVLIDHVLEHTHDFALRSLPWADLATESIQGSTTRGIYNQSYLQPVEPFESTGQPLPSMMHIWFEKLEMPESEQWEQSYVALAELSASRPVIDVREETSYFTANNYFASETEGQSLDIQEDQSLSITVPTGSDLSDTDRTHSRRDLAHLPTELQSQDSWSESSAERKRIQHSLTPLSSPESYTIAWIVALPIEHAAARAMLDEVHEAPTGFTRHQTDVNVYTWGRMGEHNIVIAALGPGVYGTTSAATIASSLLASLQSIRIGLLVGIGGGVPRPNEDHDIRLGDIVVSQPCGTMGGVCQYDLIKAKSGDKCERKGFLGRPPTVLLNALASIQSRHELKDSHVPYLLQVMLERNPKMGKRSKRNPGYAHQGFDNDRLFKSACSHVPGPDCRGCDTADEVQRNPRDTTDPDIHYGTIASSNTLVKDAAVRDRIVGDLGEECICFEAEGAGLINHFPCLVIRGICDYADSHKNDRWQRYASATAAAYAKELMAYIPAVEIQNTERALEAFQLVQQRVDSIQHATASTKAATNSIRSDLHTNKIRRWLCPPDPSTNANHARTLRYEGTGAWLLENPVFQSWYLGSHQHLWLHGLAGCGKTVLSTTVLDHLALANDALILSFFFDFNDSAKQSLDGMLRSLSFQVYQDESNSAVHLDTLFDLFEAHQGGRDQPETKALSDTVFKMLTIKRKVFLVLDALDESKTRDRVLQWIKDLVSRQELDHVQLLCTSRPESEFLRRIPPLIGEHNCLAFDKQTVNSDIRSWVTAQIAQRRDFTEKSLSHDLLERIRIKVGDGADGMFRWAFCQINSLAQCRHEAAIEKALISLPMDLNNIYQRMIESIPAERKNDAIRLLQFLVHSKRPLKLAEAKEIIATQIENESRGFNIKRRLFDETDILDYCPGLVTVVHAIDKELHLAHFSVKEYLLGVNYFEITTASISITKTCLTYLTDINYSNSKIKDDFPMEKFAAELWPRHAALAQASEDIVQITIRFLENESTFQRWSRLYQPDRSWTDNPGPPQGSRLYYTCFIGLIAPAQDLIRKGADINAQGGHYGNALQAASCEGYPEIVKLLLDHGADVNAQGGHYGNALQAASAGGHQEIVNLLLDQGADINAQGGHYDNALQAASAGGHQEIVNLLLGQGADINAQGGHYGNALQAASAGGHHEIVKLLLDKGTDINAQGGHYDNALQAASAGGHQEIVNLLLGQGADINAQGGHYGNALQAASAGGHHEIVKLLLDKGTDINAQGGHYDNALQAASAGGHQEIVNLLLDQGADINAQGGHYDNALQAASAGGHQEIVNLLLDQGADINAQGGHYDNALQAASAGGHQEIVNLLLGQGADINAQGGHYDNALQAASAGGHQEIVNLLLGQGADINAQGGHYGNALQAASAGGHHEIVKLLLDKGTDINAQGGHYDNALQAASAGGHQEIVNLLLDQGADINAQGGEYGNALQAASLRGHQEIVKLLLDKGADVSLQGGEYGNALQAASLRGYQEIVKLLLDKGAVVHAQGGVYGNALYAAYRSGNREVVKLLQSRGAIILSSK
ncbi:NACHT nucleoside triphosphatase [Penicillium citrinum]|uniref:NACHT nucleoside triphosphatase n=1 Tax=Penicillium citrinum TaxID=5077 RepID=A0A9W9P4X4_PENCI|nr:NACHT nucleoside triphosphatase [Penicillium citrinum]KAJ5235397.1 NACHT nucleoside triphosphatase [Penicillium citrinum]